MPWEREPPKGFSLKRHYEKVMRFEAFMAPYLGKSFTEQVAHDMYGSLSAQLGFPRMAHLAIRAEEVLTPDGREITAKEIRYMGLFLAEHHGVLRQGELPRQWSGRPPLWMFIRFIQIERTKDLPKTAAAQYTARCLTLTGPLSGQVLPIQLAPKYAYYLPHILGVPKKHRVEPYDARSMHGLARLGTDRGRGVSMMELQATTSLKTGNKEVYRRKHNL
jgi:hypothetical protein